jgi:hypothetical protein
MAVNLGFLLFSYLHEAEWAPFQTHYYSENLVAPRIETGTSGLAARDSDVHHSDGPFFLCVSVCGPVYALVYPTVTGRSSCCVCMWSRLCASVSHIDGPFFLLCCVYCYDSSPLTNPTEEVHESATHSKRALHSAHLIAPSLPTNTL